MSWQMVARKDQSLPVAFHFLRLTRLLMFLLLSGSYFFVVPGMNGWQKGFTLTAMFIFALNHFLYFSPHCSTKMYFGIMTLDFVVSAIFGFTFPDTEYLYLIFFGVIAVTLFLGTDDWRIVSMFGTAFLVVWGLELWNTYRHTGTIAWVSNIISFAFVVHGCLVGALIRFLQRARLTIAEQYEKLNHSHASLQDAHEQLRSYAKQVEMLTATRERNHIAREIHDTVGHTMTALLVQLQAARMLQEHDPKQSGEILLRCEELARTALQEVRLSVRNLHDEEAVHVSMIESLRKLLADFSEMTGIQTTLKVEGNPSGIPVSLQPTIYRIVQESLTNAKRHGNATCADVIVRCTDDQIAIEIVDNGQGVAKLVPGFGLINMRERIAEQGGQVQFTSEKGAGFQVSVTFPLKYQTWRYGG